MDEKAGDAVFVDLKNYMFARCRSKRSGLAISKNVVCDEETPQSTGFMKHELYFDLKLVFHEVHIQSSRHRNVIAIA